MSVRKVLDQSAAVQDSRYVTTIYLDGYQYTRAGISGRKTSYRCSYYRTGCRGKVDLITRTKKFTNFSEHSCGRRDDTELSNVTRTDPDQNVTNTPQPSGFEPPPVHPRVNPNQIDPILLGRIETPPLALVRHTTLPFFQFNCSTATGYDPNKTPNRVIGWAHPQLLELLKHDGSSIYVDTSPRHLPPCFEKCLTLVVHDHMSGFFVPVFYVLSTTRTVISYRNALYWVVQATKEKLRPNEIVCDFDDDLLTALKAQFPNAIVKGSAHLFKRDCWNSMEDLDISEEAINVAMEKGVLDMLLSIPPDRVATAGIAWVKQQIKNKCAGAGIPYAQDKWRSFWVYFKRVWISQFPPSVWNLHGLTNSVIARTNNPLEHFQRELETAFTSSDPGLQFFVATIEKLARRHVADLAAETTTLPSAVEVFSGLEDSDDGENSGTESDRSTEV